MKAKKQKSAQDIQDEIFRKMSASKKIKLVSELTMFCLKLRRMGLINKNARITLR